MIDIDALKKDIFNRFKTDKKRYHHIMGVYETALMFAKFYGVLAYDAAVASLYHDYMKNESKENQIAYLSKEDVIYYKETPVMYHALAAAAVLKKRDPLVKQDILDAILFHVWGKPNMTTLGKIIFVSDYCEPNRTFTDISIIKDLALKDLDKAVSYCMKLTLDEILEKKRDPHLDQWAAYQYYAEEKNGKTQ